MPGGKAEDRNRNTVAVCDLVSWMALTVESDELEELLRNLDGNASFELLQHRYTILLEPEDSGWDLPFQSGPTCSLLSVLPTR